MNIQWKLLIYLGILLFIYLIFNLIKRNRLSLKYSILWLLVLCFLTLLIVYSDMLIKIVLLIGDITPINLVFMIVIFSQFLLLLTLTSNISSLNNRIRDLSQEFSLNRRAK